MAFPTKATHQQTRAYNSALVLRALYDFGPISRAGVARLSGLTRTTVGDVVAQLIGDGLAREVGRGPSTGGKAPILLEFVDAARLVIAVDLGEQAFRAAIVDLRGQIRRVVERPVEGVDGDRDWQDLPLGDLLRDRYDVPAELANDSRAAALAIHLFSDPRSPNLVAIKVGRGIGAGVVLNGELFHGDGFGAGEIGHTVVDPDGAECRCGRFGCLETVASSRAILRRAGESARERGDTLLAARLSANDELTIDDVRAAMDDGDEDARRIVVAAGRYLGQAVAGLIGVLDVERIVLHGSVADLGEPWLSAVRDEAARRSLGLLSQQTTIELAPQIGDLVVMGASALLITAELGLTVAR
jgi:predicted NBD/HSP70 family sugar kinase